jgi:hypothetical protein
LADSRCSTNICIPPDWGGIPRQSAVGAAHRAPTDNTTPITKKYSASEFLFLSRQKVFHRFSFAIHSRFRTLIDARSHSPHNASRTAAPNYLLDAHAVTAALALKNSQCHNKRRKGE